jgi:hypothetical protein
MKIRHAITGVVLVAVLTVGAATASFATTPPATPTHAKPSAACITAFKKLAGEVLVDAKLHLLDRELGVVKAWAVKTHHTKVVTYVTKAEAKIKTAEGKLATAIKAEIPLVKSACKPAPATT